MDDNELKTRVEIHFAAVEIWRDRNSLINLREDWGRTNGQDETYDRIQKDIERMAKEATALELGIDPYAEGSDNTMAGQLSDAGFGSGGPQ